MAIERRKEKRRKESRRQEERRNFERREFDRGTLDRRKLDRRGPERRKENRRIDDEDIVAFSDQVEGRNAVIELLESGKDINKLYITKGEKNGSINKIIALAKENNDNLDEESNSDYMYNKKVQYKIDQPVSTASSPAKIRFSSS